MYNVIDHEIHKSIGVELLVYQTLSQKLLFDIGIETLRPTYMHSKSVVGLLQYGTRWERATMQEYPLFQ